MKTAMDYEKELAELKAALAKAKSRSGGTDGGLKLTDKGGVSLYGLGRYPVTLYVTGWAALISKAFVILDFLDANIKKLSHKEGTDSREIIAKARQSLLEQAKARLEGNIPKSESEAA